MSRPLLLRTPCVPRGASPQPPPSPGAHPPRTPRAPPCPSPQPPNPVLLPSLLPAPRKIKDKVFGPQTFWVTETAAVPGVDGGVVVRGNFRGAKDVVFSEVCRRVQELYGEREGPASASPGGRACFPPAAHSAPPLLPAPPPQATPTWSDWWRKTSST